MDFLVNNGPVPVAIDSSPEGTRRAAPRDESGQSIEPVWEYVNHGVVLTGWNKDKEGTFWTAYNPGGGEMKLYWSKYDAKQAIGIRPDLTRGLIAEMLK